ncbi:nitroreductase family protein [candidate division KSB1 bacterium]|nr:nitroreductase family protein [candidate division KSB1 bacterium]
MIELLRQRKSIRKYTGQKIEPEKIEILKEALLRSPSSWDREPCEFIFVDDKELLEKLSLAKTHGSQFLADAALGIIVCGDNEKSDVWVEDCSIASIIIQLTAQSLGLGSCWIQIRNRMHNEAVTSGEYVQQLLQIPEFIKVESIISIGYAEEHEENEKKELQYNKIRINTFE